MEHRHKARLHSHPLLTLSLSLSHEKYRTNNSFQEVGAQLQGRSKRWHIGRERLRERERQGTFEEEMQSQQPL